MSKSVVLCYSGGLDSTVLLYHLRNSSYEVKCLSVNYGQRHAKEIEFAYLICQKLRVEWEDLDMRALCPILKGSSQTSDIDVPEGHYADKNMKITVVPNRNMILLSLAGAWAVSSKSQAVAIAAHAGDHAIYPDCRPAFTEAMEEALSLCDWHPVKLMRPFLWPKSMDKTAIVKLGAELGVPFHMTWSCYKGLTFHCGKCGTCVERKEAFNLAGIKDPTMYESDVPY